MGREGEKLITKDAECYAFVPNNAMQMPTKNTERAVTNMTRMTHCGVIDAPG